MLLSTTTQSASNSRNIAKLKSDLEKRTDEKLAEALRRAHKVNRKLYSMNGIPTTRREHATNADPDLFDFHSGRYNALYAAVGDGDWPVPLPSTSAYENAFPYTAVAGNLTGTMRLTITTPAVPGNFSTGIYFDPATPNPVMIDTQILGSQWGLRRSDASIITNNLLITNIRKGIGFVQTDPRLQVLGNWPSVAPATGAQTFDLTNNQNCPRQQVMGGQISYKISCGWNSSCTVYVADPMASPQYFGNSRPSLATRNTSKNVKMSYLPKGSVWNGGNSATDITYESSNLLSGDGMTAYTLTGGGDSSTLNLEFRVIPTTASWEAIYPLNARQPSPFSGYPVVIVVAPNQADVTLTVEGWVSYNVEVDPDKGSGAYIIQEAPFSIPFNSYANRISMGVAASYASARDACRIIGQTYTHVPIETHHTMSTSHGPISIAKVEEVKPSMLSNVWQHIKSIAGKYDIPEKLSHWGSKALTQLADHLVDAASAAAPLLLL
jgi:hypothetical protein